MRNIAVRARCRPKRGAGSTAVHRLRRFCGASNDGRGISNIRDNGDGTLTVEYTDNNTAGPFAMPAGPQGDQGRQGEVTSQQLTDAIGGTSANSNAVQPLGLTVSDPPTQSELQAVANKIDELIGAMRR